MADFEARLTRLRDQLLARELDRLIITNVVNARWLTGFTGTNAAVVVGAEHATLLTDFRYLSQARDQSSGFEIVDGGGEPRVELAKLLYGRTGIDDAQMSVQSYRALEQVLGERGPGSGGSGAVELVSCAGVVEDLRSVKDLDEIAAIEAAAALADTIYETLAKDGISGHSEREIAWRIELLAHQRGAQGLSFPPIVAAGAHGARPHAQPRDHVIEIGELVVLDLGVILDGYCSDATRTFATGEVSPEAREIYELVHTAQLAALAAACPGVDCRDVDAAARDLIARAGHGERFGHGIGHGVGLEVHERPNLSVRSEAKLQIGNVVTIEPGVYVEGGFGVRIEDLVLVDGDGPRALSSFTKELLTVG